MNDRIALVTGAARGIGAAVAIRLAKEGHDIALLDLDVDSCYRTASAVEALGCRVCVVAADVANEVSVSRAVAELNEVLGQPLVLVNNAGVLREKLFFQMDLDEWHSVMRVNLDGAFLMSRAVQGFMVSAGWGRIINMSSSAALGNAGRAHYAASKSGLHGLTKTLALELGKYGVTVNAVAPGFISTDMTREASERLGLNVEDVENEVASSIAVRRVGLPEDIANAVAFFADERSGFVSGQVFYVAGGPVGLS